ncbi:MAG: hypothetical protein LBQ66_02910 [Planctomycetaceae bacterium]|nr:hypothetical protein [Planctomycetaceae bacterium]
MPTRFGVQFKLVRFYYAQRRAGHPRSSPPPLRGILKHIFGVPSKLVRFYYAQRRAGRPRSSPRRFAAIVGYANGWRFEIQTRFTLHFVGSKPPSLTVENSLLPSSLIVLA